MPQWPVFRPACSSRESEMATFSEDDLLTIAVILDEEEEEQVKKRKWVHQAWQTRGSEGEFATLYSKLTDDGAKFYEYFRMSENTFNLLLHKLEDDLQKRDTHWRKAITARERLAVCLRYLATGDALNTILFSYRMGHSTVHKIVRETCNIITKNLMDELMPTPTEDMWKNIAKDFYEIWNFPNCIGALDGKHVTIQAPPNTGSLFFNYKKTFSIVLLALVDAHCNFIAVDVGAYGKNSDGGIFAASKLGKALQQGCLNVPADSTIPNTDTHVPYVIVADEAFPLKTYLMRPYPGDDLDDSKRSFNSRLSRARRTAENTFGILSQKFRIYNRRIQAFPKYVDDIILATCLLHNFIKKYDRNTYNYVTQEVELRSGRGGHTLCNLHLQGGNATTGAFRIRELFTNYFSSEAGSLPWPINI